MFDSVYHDIKVLKNCIFGVKMSRFCHLLRYVKMDIIL